MVTRDGVSTRVRGGRGGRTGETAVRGGRIEARVRKQA